MTAFSIREFQPCPQLRRRQLLYRALAENGGFMTLSLPQPIDAYFAANSTFDVDAMLAPFAADAIVQDEGGTHKGAAAIRAWIERATVGNQAVSVPRAIRTENDTHHVTARVEGAFQGSPITLTFHFRLKGGQITELEID
jgi:SnoaL-like domain